MEVDKLMEAAAVINELNNGFVDLPESPREATLASLTLTMAELYLVEMANHLIEGKEPYDALLATARGEMTLPKSAEAKLTLMKLLAAKPTKE